MSALTTERVRELLDYEPSTGTLRWRVANNGRIKVGDVAGSLQIKGYLDVRVDGTLYKAHRVIWLHVYGHWPINVIDHIDGNKLNNALHNLREATHLENQHNKGITRANRSGHKGVHRVGEAGKWRAQITVGRKIKSLGSFDSAEEAAAAYRAASEIHHGEFAHGK